MRINVVVKPGSKNGPYVQTALDGSLLVCVREPALEGKANKAVTVELAKYFKVSKSCVVLVRGGNTKYKVFDINK